MRSHPIFSTMCRTAVVIVSDQIGRETTRATNPHHVNCKNPHHHRCDGVGGDVSRKIVSSEPSLLRFSIASNYTVLVRSRARERTAAAPPPHGSTNMFGARHLAAPWNGLFINHSQHRRPPVISGKRHAHKQTAKYKPPCVVVVSFFWFVLWLRAETSANYVPDKSIHIKRSFGCVLRSKAGRRRTNDHDNGPRAVCIHDRPGSP